MKKLLLLFIVFILVGCSSVSEYKMITKEEAKDLIKNNKVIIIDVRSNIEYNINHIENAINIPLDSINKDELVNVTSSLNDNIIVYCQSGFRSKEASIKLLDFGYVNVYDLGSIDNWGEDSE